MINRDNKSVDFGPNVLIFDPSMPKDKIQGKVDEIFKKMEASHFTDERYALFFKPGAYEVSVGVGFFTSVYGLGKVPDDVLITGAVRSEAKWMRGNATCNFWRSAENYAVIPTTTPSRMVEVGTETWGASQAAPMRRVHVKGNLNLWDPHPENKGGSWSSGGFIADSVVDGVIDEGTQQQYFTRNTKMGSWDGSNWNMVFVGDIGNPKEDWPKRSDTVIEKTPIVREKPFIYFDEDAYKVFVPGVRKDTMGVSWENGIGEGKTLPIEDFTIAQPHHSAKSINQALNDGKHVIFTPGIYKLLEPIRVTQPNTVVLGLGMATLLALNGNIAMTVADVEGVVIAGLLYDAGEINSPILLEVGTPGCTGMHAHNPITLIDLYFRVGGAAVGKADVSLLVHSHDVIGDHFWVWRADHGKGGAWDVNTTKNGVVVNGDRATFYGLFVEHYHEYQTLWNGNQGRVYFYQSEIPYDVPSQEAWMSGKTNGFASYKVADSVTEHSVYGTGVYSVFKDADVKCHSGVEVPDAPGVQVYHACSIHLIKLGEITHVVNNEGEAATLGVTWTKLEKYPR